MTDPANLANSLVPEASPELREAVILDDATERGQAVRCVVPSVSGQIATDPMEWRPYVTAEGEFWPKKDERAVLAFPPDGPPVVAWWEPGEREADSAIEGGEGSAVGLLAEDGLGVIVHGEDTEVARGTDFAHYLWIGSVVPANAVNHDLLAKHA